MLDEIDESSGKETLLRKYKGYLSQFFKDRPGPYDTIVKEHFVNGRFWHNKELVVLLFFQLLLDVNIEPCIDWPPEVLFIDFAAV